MVAPGGACMVAPGGACVVALGGECAWFLWGACVVAPGGVHGYSWGACVVAPGGCAWLLWGGGCVVALGGCAWLLRGGHAWLLLGGACVVARGGACMGYDEIRRYGQWAGGTHPTGMHSCFIYFYDLKRELTTHKKGCILFTTIIHFNNNLQLGKVQGNINKKTSKATVSVMSTISGTMIDVVNTYTYYQMKTFVWNGFLIHFNVATFTLNTRKPLFLFDINFGFLLIDDQ